jgi:hypothetical protein
METIRRNVEAKAFREIIQPIPYSDVSDQALSLK